MSVRPPVLMEQLGSHWKGLHENLYLSVFQKSVKKNQVLLKSDNKTGTLPADFSTALNSS